jgi:type IV conjugative transfer system coupling protein TraD
MKNLVRGGQTSIHSLRMIIQLFFTIWKMLLFSTIIINLINLFRKYDLFSFKELLILQFSRILVFCGFENYNIHFVGRYKNIYDLKAKIVSTNPNLILLEKNLLQTIENGFVNSFLFGIFLIIILVISFAIKGKKLTKEKFIRGGKIVSSNQLKKITKRFNFLQNLRSFKFNFLFSKNYSISSIPLPNDVEFLHTIILGSTGTGKTNAILDLLDQIRQNGDRAIIYDKMGTYTANYYQAQKDVILNPLDQRSKSWSFYNEIRKESDYDYIASALIPEKKDSSGPFWNDSARRVFSVFAQKLKNQTKENPSNKKFLQLLLKSNFKILADFLSSTSATSLINAESEKTSLSILAILSAYLSSLKYLKDDDSDDNFSIRNWIELENNDSFLFISSRSDQHDSLQPLISTWIDIAIKALLSLEQNNYSKSEKRRVWIILDEIGSLQQMPSLLDGLAQSRQFGGAFILSLHSISQLKSIYGKDKTDTITSLCRNKLFFAGADDETAEYCSQNLGHQEIEEVKEGISYGANEIRDGVSLNNHKSQKRIVISSQIMYMKSLEAYLKFAGNFPISKIDFKIKNRPKIAERFIDNILPNHQQFNANFKDKISPVKPDEDLPEDIEFESAEDEKNHNQNNNFSDEYDYDKETGEVFIKPLEPQLEPKSQINNTLNNKVKREEFY